MPKTSRNGDRLVVEVPRIRLHEVVAVDLALSYFFVQPPPIGLMYWPAGRLGDQLRAGGLARGIAA